MEKDGRCPECGGVWTEGATCQDHFHQMAAWELTDPRLQEVHHLMVLCYHLQHPSLYSPEGLEWGKRLLVDFVDGGIATDEVRRRDRASLDSGRRKFKIRGTPEAHGRYARPVQWAMVAGDVTAGGTDAYCENVRAWARSVLRALRDSRDAPLA